MSQFQFATPWHPIIESSGSIELQLYKEIGEKHFLFGKEAKAIARRQDCDDVLFEIKDSNYNFGIVHLTWSNGRHTTGEFPSTYLYTTVAEAQIQINKDIADWIEMENTPFNERGGYIEGKQRIIIIGASSGIGKKLAELYALEGNLVGITGRRNELLEKLQTSFSGRIITSCFDITLQKNVEHLESLISKIGGLDLLIISAGTGEPSKDLDWDIDKKTVDTNVNGFVAIANYAFNYFLKQGHGQLVTISSIAAIRGGSWAPAYNASKSFQSNYFEGLSIKAAKLNKNITVTCIEPGFVDTKMAKGDGIFWLVPVNKAATQIITAIEKKKRKAYISRRWWLIAKLMKYMPYWLLKRIG